MGAGECYKKQFLDPLQGLNEEGKLASGQFGYNHCLIPVNKRERFPDPVRIVHQGDLPLCSAFKALHLYGVVQIHKPMQR